VADPERVTTPWRYEFVPLWNIKVFFVYAPRRVNCSRCGVKVEALPWSTGKRHLTDAYAWFLADWAKRLSWKEVAGVFRTSWEQVFRAVEMAVNRGCEHRTLSGIASIGIDEVQWQRGHKYRPSSDSFQDWKGLDLRSWRRR
jgi:transposase